MNKNQTWRRVLTLICVMAMLVGIMVVGSVVASAAENDPAPVASGNVAKVGNTEYATIDEAIANWTNNSTLTLLANVTLSDVVKLKSTEHHTLNLGTYTLTAASGKNAIEITCEGRSSASYALTVNADANNPGGITAKGNSCIYYKKSGTTKDRPIILINNGVFTGSYSLNIISNGNTNCPQIWINNGTFNSYMNLTKCMLRVSGGTFDAAINCTGDQNAYRQISGGRFKSWQFMTADAPNKFAVSSAFSKDANGNWIGSYDVGAYVDDAGYLVVGGNVVTEAGDTFEASSANYGGWSSYLKYSSAATNGLYYTSVEEALADNNKSTGSVTVYVDELDLTGINYKGTIVVPEGKTLKITNAPEGLKTEGNVKKVVPVAEVNGAKYESVQAAIDAAQNGETVKIYAGEFAPINISNKNITIQGTVGANGELLTIIKGGNPAITGHGFNGTIKDIKVVDAFKVMYAEPAGNVTVDNVYVTGATYGFHLVAYSQGLTWTIQNSYMDLSWANSFGVSGSGDAAIIVKGNEFVSTAPYYPDYGAIHVNSFLPNVTVEENVFGENAKIYIDGSVTDTSKLNISKNYHANGVENAFADDAEGVKINILEYYADEAKTNLVKRYVQIGANYYATLAEAAAAAQADDEIVLLANASGDVTVPHGVIFNGNGFTVNGILTAAGDITFKNVTKASDLDFAAYNTTVTIGEGASLQLIGSARMSIGFGTTFNITGTITDAKTADKATLTPSLVLPGISFTGSNGVNFNVTNAYIKVPSSYSSTSKTASGNFKFNIENSIWESAGKLAFEEQSVNATVNFNLKNSVLTTGSHLVFGVSNGEIVIDNSNVNVGASNLLENCSTMIIKNGSVVNGAVATSSNAKNPGTVIVENATYAVTGEFSGSDLGTGAIIIKNGATVSVGSVSKANITVDARGMQAGDNIDFTANLNNFAGTLEVINNDKLIANIVDGKIVLALKPVASVNGVKYTSLVEAFKAATEGCTIEILADVTIDGKWDCRDYATGGSHSQFKESVTINGNGHTIKFVGTVSDNNWNTIFRFEENATVNNLTVDISEATGAQRVISAKKSLTVDRLTILGSAKYGIIFGEGSSAADFAAAEIAITNSTLTGTRRAISDNEGGKDVKSVVITGNTLNANVYVSASESITFNNNTANGEVDLRSYAAENVLSVVAKGNTLTAGAKNYILAKTVDAQSEFTTTLYVSTKNELNAALAAAQEGDTIVLIADIDYGTDQLALTKAITLDLGGKTLTTRNAWGGMSVKGNPTIKNGTIVHASNTAAIKVWNATAFEDLVIDVQGKGDANKTIGGIVLQEGSTTRVGSIKNVTIKGAALTNGIETYNCGDATENVIGSLENVTINAAGTGMLISAPVGTATNCTIKGGVNAVELWIKGNYSATLTLDDCALEGGVYAHDEFKEGVVNNGTLGLIVDAETTGADVTLTLNRPAENAEGVIEEVINNAQAKLNNTYYATVQAAINAAKAGETVTILPGEYSSFNISNKNITIQGTVGANGELLTTIKGGNPAITGHGFNGTIKDLKIVDAFKVMYAEPAGNVTVDNVYVTGATYGFHLVAYSQGVEWTIQNSYMDLSWANSFGTYSGGAATIIIKGNVFESTAPYYPAYGALAVNSQGLHNVTVEGNVFGENAKILLTDASYASISKNYHADGVDNALAEDSAKAYIASYYKNSDLTELVNLLKGTGTEADPYQIGSAADLALFRDSVNAGEGRYNNAYVVLTADIDLAGINWTPIGNVDYNSKYAPADTTKVFSGTFDGNDKVIYNLTMTKILNGGADAEANLGLFGITGEGATIKNVTLTNVTITTDGRNVGALAGFAYMATLDNITVNGDIAIKGGNNVAGVCAMTRHHAMSATNITVKGDDLSYIEGNNIVGGIFAEIAPNGTAQTFKNLSIENVAITGRGGVGGIVGLLTDGTVENVTVKNVEITANTSFNGDAMGRIRMGSVAGLLGSTKSTIKNAKVENVTAKNLDGNAVKLPVIGANYTGSIGNATEAKIGDTYYATLKLALEVAWANAYNNIGAKQTVTVYAVEGDYVLELGAWGGIDWTLAKGILTIAPTNGTPELDPNVNDGKTRYEVGAWREAVVYKKGEASSVGGWPYDRSKVKTLIIEEGVTKIGSFTAQGFTNLTGEVVIPSTVTYIGQEAFQKSTMTKLTFAAGGTEELCIAQGAFKNLIITEVSLPEDRPVHLHAWVFNNCHNLKNVYLPASLVSVFGTNHIDYFNDFNEHSNPTWTQSSEIFAYNENMESITFGSEEVRDMFYSKSNNGTSKDYLVATVGLTTYGNFADAWAAVTANGGTLKLLKNVTLTDTITVPAGAEVTLDLNGKTISQTKTCTESYSMIQNNGSLTITGNGKISLTDNGAGDPNFGWGSYTITNNGTLVVENGTIEFKGNQAFATHCSLAIFHYNGSTTINGGKIVNNSYRSVRIWHGDVTINGGTFEGQVWVHCVDDSAKLTINGGSFAPATSGDASSVFVNNAGKKAELSVTGGTFNGKIGANDAAALAGAVTGGLFTETAKNGTNVTLLAQGFIFADEVNADGFYTLAEGLRGAGTEADPYLISNVEDLIFFRNSVNAGETKYNASGVVVALAAHLDLAGATWERGIGDGINATFDGIFDGKGYTIKNLNLAPEADSDKYFCGGLFGYTYGAVEIKNLVLENITVTAVGEGHNVGVLVGFANNNGGKLNVTNVTVKDVKINAPDAYGVGVIVGYSYRAMGTISNCSVDNATVTGHRFVGGITGYGNTESVITGCSVSNSVITATIGAGSIAGIVNNGQVTNNTVTNVTVNAPANAGTVGEISGTVTVDGTVGGTWSGIELAKIGNTYYAGLESALAAAKAGDTITLFSTYVVEAGDTKELNLPKDVTVSMVTDDVKMVALILNYGNLTITGEGKLSYQYTGNDQSDAHNTIESAPGSVLTIKGGIIENLSENCLIAYAVDGLTNGGNGDVTINIEGGKLSSKKIAVRIFANSTTNTGYLNISGGEILGRVILQNASAKANKAALNITGGTFTSNGYKADVLNVGGSNGSTADFAVSVSGGTFNGEILNYIETGFITGGTFTSVAEADCAAGYIPTKNPDGTYGVKVGKFVARNTTTGVGYETLQAAINAAKAGETVTVFAGKYAMPSMKAGITLVGEGNVIFEGTLSGTLENLTLKNIHIKGSNAQRWAYAKGNLVFENVTFEATSIYALHFDGIAEGTNLLYKGCTIIGWAAMGGTPASATFDTCTFKGNGTYGVIRTYFDATITNCTFNVANVNTNDAYEDGIHAVDGAEVIVTGCTNANGNMEDIVNVHSTSVVTVDGKEIKNVAIVGDNYYTSLQAAIEAAADLYRQDNDQIPVIKLFADCAENVHIGDHDDHYAIKLKLDLNGKKYTGIITLGLASTLEAPKDNYTVVPEPDTASLVYIFGVWMTTAHHLPAEPTVVPPTCKTEGYSYYKCTQDGCTVEFRGEKKDKLDHNYVTTVVDPDFGVEGYTLTTCDRGCGHYEKTNIVPALVAVAENNGTKYTTVQAAIDAAQAGDTVTLLADINDTVTINKNLTLDGAGFKFTGKLNVNSNLNVTVTNVNFVKGHIVEASGENGTLTITNSNFDGENAIDYAIKVEGLDELVVENTTVKNYKIGMLYVPRSAISINMKGVNVENVAAAFNILYTAGGTFEDITVKNATYGFHTANYGSRTFKLINCDLECDNPIYVPKKGTAKVIFEIVGTENEFVTNTAYTSAYTLILIKDGAKLNVTNEVYALDVNVITDVDKHTVAYEDGAYVLEKILDPVAKIGDAEYTSVQAAINAAKPGDTIKLISDVYFNGSEAFEGGKFQYSILHLVHGQEITIDFNGHKMNVEITKQPPVLTGNMLVSVFFVEEGANVTFVDNSTEGNGGIYAKKIQVDNVILYCLIYNASATVTIESGNYVAEEVSDSLVYADKVNNTYIKGGFFNVMNYTQAKPWVSNVHGKNEGNFVEYTGGTFNHDPLVNRFSLADCEVYIPNGYVVVDNKNGTWSVIEAAAKVGNEYFQTLAEAMAYCNKNAGTYTIELVDNVNEVFTFAQNKNVNITIDGNNKAFVFTGKITLTTGYGELKFTNTVITPKNSHTVYINAQSTPNVTFDNCILAGEGSGAIVWGQYSGGNAYITIKNCEASNLTYIVNIRQGGYHVYAEEIKASDMTYLFRTNKCPDVYVKKVEATKVVIPFEIKNDSTGTLTLENVTVDICPYSDGKLYAPVNGKDPDSTNTAHTFNIVLKGNTYFTHEGAKYDKTEWFDGNAGYKVILIDSVDGNLNFNKDIGFTFTFNTKYALRDDYKAVITVAGEKYEIYAKDWNANKATINLFAKQMTDEITVVVMWGDREISKTITTSVRAYYDAGVKAERFTAKDLELLNAMLHYGAAAQKAFGYNTENLAYVDVEAPANVAVESKLEAERYFGSTLNLDSHIVFNFKFLRDSLDVAYAMVNGKEYKVTYETNASVGQLVVVKVDDLYITDANELLTCTLYDAQGNALRTAKDSVTSYCARAITGLTNLKNSNETAYNKQALKEDFYQALANYVNALSVYRANSNTNTNEGGENS